MQVKYFFYLVIFSWSIVAFAQSVPIFSSKNTKVIITEISPHKVKNEKEWFEFTIEGGEAVDITDWKISNGASSTKIFSDKKDDLILSEGGIDLAGETVVLSGSGTILSGSGFSSTGFSGTGYSLTLPTDRLIFLPQNRAWFFWQKAPISLPNNGGTVQILNENNEILDEINYPKTKSGKFEGNPYAEIWNRHKTKTNELFPLIFRANGDLNFSHTKGHPNYSAPSFSNEIEILISEVSPNREQFHGAEFIELFVKSTVEEKANLKYMEIKHNGTPLIFINHDFYVKKGDFIVINLDNKFPLVTSTTNPHQISTNKRSGISAGSGTVEVILYSGTSWEKTEDFVCWKKGKLSQIEQSRVNKNIDKGNWSGACLDISELIKNESIARFPSYLDSNTKNDFFRHFNGSIGVENISQNNSPIAKITVQRTGRVVGTAPFSLNLTGEDSVDLDGFHDLKIWEWKIGNVVFSTVSNPKSITLSSVGHYKISLYIEDYSGASDQTFLEVEVINPSGGASIAYSRKDLQKWLKKELEKKFTSKIKLKNSFSLKKNKISDDFFNEFLINLDPKLLQELLIISKNSTLMPTSFKSNSKERETESQFKNLHRILIYQRQKFTKKQKERLAKNLGIIFEN